MHCPPRLGRSGARMHSWWMVLQLSLLLCRKDIKKKLNTKSCLKRIMTRRMLNLLHSISYDWNVCCKEELAPAVSASVRKVEHTYYFFFLAEGIARAQCRVVWSSVQPLVEDRVINSGPPSLCRRAVCAGWRKMMFDHQACMQCSSCMWGTAASSAKALPRMHMSNMYETDPWLSRD